MTDPLTTLATLHRPRLMVRAARLGMGDYRRDRDLRRLLGTGRTPSPAAALPALMHAEADAEDIRQSGAATYNIARHVDLLIAVLAEARLLERPAD